MLIIKPSVFVYTLKANFLIIFFQISFINVSCINKYRITSKCYNKLAKLIKFSKKKNLF